MVLFLLFSNLIFKFLNPFYHLSMIMHFYSIAFDDAIPELTLYFLGGFL